MDRRRFLRLLLSFFSFAALAAFAYPAIRFLLHGVRVKEEPEKLVLAKAEVIQEKIKEIVFNNTPAIIIYTKDNGIIALSRVCTHLGCLVSYDRDRDILICPCHVGIYDLEGNVISGPPPKPLQKFPLRIEGGNVVIG